MNRIRSIFEWVNRKISRFILRQEKLPNIMLMSVPIIIGVRVIIMKIEITAMMNFNSKMLRFLTNNLVRRRTGNTKEESSSENICLHI